MDGCTQISTGTFSCEVLVSRYRHNRRSEGAYQEHFHRNRCIGAKLDEVQCDRHCQILDWTSFHPAKQSYLSPAPRKGASPLLEGRSLGQRLPPEPLVSVDARDGRILDIVYTVRSGAVRDVMVEDIFFFGSGGVSLFGVLKHEGCMVLFVFMFV